MWAEARTVFLIGWSFGNAAAALHFSLDGSTFECLRAAVWALCGVGLLVWF
jgi:hypothetical protein